MVTKNLVVEVFRDGLAVRAQGPHCLRGGRGSGRHAPGRPVERIEHVGSSHTDAELALLLAAAREWLSQGQDVLDLGDLPVVPARMDELADWTGAPELPLQRAAGGRPASVAAAGGSWGPLQAAPRVLVPGPASRAGLRGR